MGNDVSSGIRKLHEDSDGFLRTLLPLHTNQRRTSFSKIAGTFRSSIQTRVNIRRSYKTLSRTAVKCTGTSARYSCPACPEQDIAGFTVSGTATSSLHQGLTAALCKTVPFQAEPRGRAFHV